MGDFAYRAYPVVFWDLFGRTGHPVRTTVSEMGPLMLARMMDLSEAQEGVLNIAFRVADEQGLTLLDLKDLQAMLVWLGDNAQEIGRTYGNIASASLGAIQRQLLVLENQGEAQTVAVWRWQGWSFSLVWRSENGRYQDLTVQPGTESQPPLIITHER